MTGWPRRDEEPAISPDLLDFFRRVRDLADDAVWHLEVAAGVRPYKSRGRVSTDPVGLADLTQAEVDKAREWLTDAREKAAAGTVEARGVDDHLDSIDGLISFAERVLRR